MGTYTITQKQYNYLLPVFGICSNNFRLVHRVEGNFDKYYFIGNHDEYLDMLNRCKYIND